MQPSPASKATSAEPSGAVLRGYSAMRGSEQAEAATVLSPAQRLALGLLRAYKLAFSPWFAGSCRFLPSCSDYAAEAVTKFGVMPGSMLAARRLARCHPLGAHGLDPVPDRKPRA
jgi:uncharacterized protein